jgi:hypothetical protein
MSVRVLWYRRRYRTNVWEYRGVNTLKAGRMDELALHPTVKPVAMIADAIKDVSRRGGIVLDLFGGSGSTLIAAHKTGRRARLCELDPVYCDRILSRWERFAKDDAELLACGLSSARPGVATSNCDDDGGGGSSKEKAETSTEPAHARTSEAGEAVRQRGTRSRPRPLRAKGSPTAAKA